MPTPSLVATSRTRATRSYVIALAITIVLATFPIYSLLPYRKLAIRAVRDRKDPLIGSVTLLTNGDPDSPPWSKRVQNGKMLRCLMENPDTKQSTFTHDDLVTWGWESAIVTGTARREFRKPLMGAYLDNEINPDLDCGVGLVQNTAFKNDKGEMQQPTMGSVHSLINLYCGSIVAGNNVSPVEMAKRIHGEDLPPDKLPKLQKWSDAVSLQWQMEQRRDSNVPKRAINFIFRVNIDNDNTRSMIWKASEKAGESEIKAYPGLEFVMPDDKNEPKGESFYGLLGTYHGAGPAYLLAQHREIFGSNKMITKIQVWNDRKSWRPSMPLGDMNPSMMFSVNDIPNYSW